MMIHLGTYGIRDVGGELWKAKDIHIGVLGFVFPVTIMGTVAVMVFGPLIRMVVMVFGPLIRPARPLWIRSPVIRPAPPLWRGGRRRRVDGEWWLADLRSLATGFIIVPLELAFYCFAMLHRDSASEEPYGVLALMLVISFSIPIFFSPLENAAQWVPEARWLRRLARWSILRFGIAALVIKLSREGMWGYWPPVEKMWSVNRSRILLYALLLLLICASLYLARQRYLQSHEMRFWFLTFPLVGLMYYLTLVGFAHCFFPYIPAPRGGGDYMLAPAVSVQLKKGKNATSSALDAFLSNGDPKVLIDETPTTIFVADECTEGGPSAWSQNRPRARPRVWALGRDSVATIRYTVAAPDVDLRARCPRGLWTAGD